MERSKLERRGWLCALLSPAACVLFLLGSWAGLWTRTGDRLATVLAGILMVEMLAGTVAPFWWLLSAFRQRGVRAPSKILIGANILAILVSILFFF